MNFKQFAASDLRNAWLREPGIEIYVRRSIPGSNHGDFELANMNAKTPGNGSLTKFLNQYEPEYSFYIENILEARLLSYFERRGYHRVGEGWLDVYCVLKD